MVFNISILGASHVKDNKPCQDYSVAWQSEEDGAVVLIVCDGHGSDTYVRSDVGSRLAGEIALEAVKRFILPVGDVRPDSDWIAGVQGAVTARENDVLTRYSEALPRAEEDMTDTDWMRYRQRLEFRGQVKGIYEQDAIFQALFSSIYEKWLEAIHIRRKSEYTIVRDKLVTDDHLQIISRQQLVVLHVIFFESHKSGIVVRLGVAVPVFAADPDLLRVAF